MTTENIPTIAEIQEATLNMKTVTEEVESTEPTLVDQYGTTRKTMTGREEDATNQLLSQEQTFVNRFALSDTPVAWSAFLSITNELQLYSTGVIGESGYTTWLADPQLLPFTTSATFAEDDELNRWTVATVATQEWTAENSTDELEAIALSLNTAENNVTYGDADTVLAGYVHPKDQEITYSVPANAVGETIASITDDALLTVGGDTYLMQSVSKIKPLRFFNVATMIANSSSFEAGMQVSTLGYYDMTGAGASAYSIESGSADGLVDHDLGNGLIAKLIFNELPTFEQCGGRLFESRSDIEFNSVDAGVVVNNALTVARVHGLSSVSRGFTSQLTPIVIDRSFELNLGGLDWAGSVDNHFEFVVSSALGSGESALLVSSGVRQVHLYNFKMKCYSFGTGINGIRLGLGDYAVDTDNINSNCVISNVICERFENAYYLRQLFLTSIDHCQAIDSNFAGFYFTNGGTSVSIETSNVDGGQYGFCVDESTSTKGLVYSSMDTCVVENTTVSAYLLRNTSVSMIGCGQENCSGSILTLIGTGNVTISNFDNINSNTTKPDQIFNMLPSSVGQFGYNVTLSAMSTSVSGFSGTQVNFLNAPATEPTSSLSTARWIFNEGAFKQDPTGCLDTETWKSGAYYEAYVPLDDQINMTEVYTRNGVSHTQANIDLEIQTSYVITGQLTSTAGTFYFKMSLALGFRPVIDVALVDVYTAALADTDGNGKILQCDGGANNAFSAGSLYLEAYNKSGENLSAEVSGSTLILKLDTSVMGGKIVIEKKKSLVS